VRRDDGEDDGVSGMKEQEGGGRILPDSVMALASIGHGVLDSVSNVDVGTNHG
jgi:hypothetical protein